MKNPMLITQVRVGSTRFPKKIFHKIKNKSLLEIFIERALQINSLKKIIVTVPDTSENDIILDELKTYPIEVVRGDENDVLSRYYKAVQNFSPSDIIRITSDCPFFEPNIVDHMIQFYYQNELDYVSNNLKNDWPHGLDVEIFSSHLLELANKEATSEYDKEHVTPWIRNNKITKKKHFECNLNINKRIRLTVDYVEDYLFLKELLKKSTKNVNNISISDINEIIKLNPNLLIINKDKNLRINL